MNLAGFPVKLSLISFKFTHSSRFYHKSKVTKLRSRSKYLVLTVNSYELNGSVWINQQKLIKGLFQKSRIAFTSMYSNKGLLSPLFRVKRRSEHISIGAL